ncbi:MAG TPA: hypothetical protein VH498_08255 [Candidatus Dormibacteraeota bacterium]|nr:hypothetical protein [Candidatus Dormibacteraeota bacterium]
MLRFPFGRRGLLAAAAISGAIVYWRVAEQRRSREASAEIDDAIAEGRAAADRLLAGSAPEAEQFDER